MNRISDAAHALLAVIGVVVALQAPLTAYLVDAGVPVKIADLALGAAGLVVTGWSKWTDSSHDAAVVAAGAHPPAAA